MRRNFFFIAIIIALISSVYFYKEWNKPHKEAASSAADVTISPQQLLADYNADENVANSKYLEKVIAISGIVKSMNQVETGSSLSLDSGDDMATIICEFESKDATTGVKVGDSVKIKGICSGKLMDIVLNRCALEK